MPFVDVLFGHEGDVAATLGESSHGPVWHTLESFGPMAERVATEFPHLRAIASTVRQACDGESQRVERVCVCGRAGVRGVEVSGAGDPGSRGWGGLVCGGIDLWAADGQGSAVGAGLRGGAWSAGDDDAGGWPDGDARRGGAADGVAAHAGRCDRLLLSEVTYLSDGHEVGR